MFKNLRKRTEGFTIIEVLIVLAIAGLIMLIVFLAVPALQRNQRNNARVSDASRIAASVSECLANRNGVTASCDGLTLDATFQSTTTSELQVGRLSQLTGGLAGAPSQTAAQLQFGTANGGCSSDGSATAAGASARSFSLVYEFEPGGNTNRRCISG